MQVGSSPFNFHLRQLQYTSIRIAIVQGKSQNLRVYVPLKRGISILLSYFIEAYPVKHQGVTFGLFICRGDTETFAFATSYIVILSYSLLRRDGTVAILAQVDHPASTMWRRQAYRISSGAHRGNFMMALISVINILVSSRVRGQKSAIFKAISALFAICSIVKVGRTKIQDHVAELMISKDHNETPRDPSSLKQVDNRWLGARFPGFEEYVQEHK